MMIMVKMISPTGDTCEVPENRVERNLTRGFSLPKTPKKTTEPVEVLDDSHEETQENIEE